MLRAAYFAQELLSTFSTDLGEVALVPKTGGVFTVTIWHGTMNDGQITTQESILWDRKRDGGFPEVKALKSLVRNVIAPNRDLGHTDRALKKEQGEQESKEEEKSKSKAGCEDCQ
jgi:predicted Rdx family selenoprotein